MLVEDHHIAVLPPGPPLLQVVVDTEEEFDWSKPFDRSQTATTSIAAQPAIQAIFDRYHLKPAYVLDYPVAVCREAAALKEIYDSGRCLIGAHLQPWVNPPFEEAVTARNSYPGNLPVELERRKLELLGEAIAERFGTRPVLYKAGRYGVGPATPGILKSLGYLVDLSVVSHTDFGADGGPDFRGCPDRPYWFGPNRELLEIPLTRGLWGLASHRDSALQRAALSRRWRRMATACARLGVLQRLSLTPEGFDSVSHRRLIRTLLRRGHRVFTLTYHSPSAVPGHTPYVRSRRDLVIFLDRIKRLLDFFFGELNGQATTPLEVRALALSTRRHAAERAASHAPERATA